MEMEETTYHELIKIWKQQHEQMCPGIPWDEAACVERMRQFYAAAEQQEKVSLTDAHAEIERCQLLQRLLSGEDVEFSATELHDFLKVRFPMIPSLVGGKIIIPQGLTIVGGREKAGKSLLAQHLALNRSSGENWLGFPTLAGRTLYVNAEIPAAEFQARFAKLTQGRVLPPKDTVFIENVLGMDAYINMSTGEKLIEGMIERYAPDFVILDTLSKTLKGNESSSEDMQSYLQKLATWRLRYRTAFLLVHHFRKSFRDNQGRRVPISIEDLSGSSHLARDADGFILMDVDPGAPVGTVKMVLRHAESIDWFKVERGEDLWWRSGGPDTEPSVPSPTLNETEATQAALAVALLDELLPPGSVDVPVAPIQAEADKRGVGASTLLRTREKLGVTHRWVGRAVCLSRLGEAGGRGPQG